MNINAIWQGVGASPFALSPDERDTAARILYAFAQQTDAQVNTFANLDGHLVAREPLERDALRRQAAKARDIAHKLEFGE